MNGGVQTKYQDRGGREKREEKNREVSVRLNLILNLFSASPGLPQFRIHICEGKCQSVG